MPAMMGCCKGGDGDANNGDEGLRQVDAGDEGCRGSVDEDSEPVMIKPMKRTEKGGSDSSPVGDASRPGDIGLADNAGIESDVGCNGSKD